jgi:ABC-type transport system involved in cytochrome bd biosynthesis fused ATPase/permease subunit
VSDVDGLTELWVRAAARAVTAVLAGATGVLVAAVGVRLVAAASLGVALVAAPAAAHRLPAGRGPRCPDRRAQQQLLTVLEGAAELAVYDRLDDELQQPPTAIAACVR